jgi:hypothetical protein
MFHHARFIINLSHPINASFFCKGPSMHLSIGLSDFEVCLSPTITSNPHLAKEEAKDSAQLPLAVRFPL